MSVQSEDSRIQYSGDGITTVFPVPFYFFSEDDLKVVLGNEDGVETYLERGVDFSVNGAGNEEGGEVVAVAAPEAGTRVTIYREIEVTQTTVYGENAEFPAKSHEKALDKLTMICQQINADIARCFRARPSDGNVSEFPLVASTVLGLNSSKQARTYTAEQLAVWLNLTQQFFGEGTKTFLDAGDKDLAIPDFLGQLGVQLDEGSVWVADGVTAGDWTTAVGAIADGSITTAKLAAGILAASSGGRALMEAGFFASGNATSIAHFANNFLPLAKLVNIAQGNLLGRYNSGSGAVELISIGTGLSYSGGTLTATAAAPANGSLIQSVYAEYTANANITSVMPCDDTTPQNTEGMEILSLAITPTSPTSILRLRLNGYGTAGQTCGAAIFKDSDANAIAASAFYAAGGGQVSAIGLEKNLTAGGTSAITFKVRVGPSTAGTLRLNGITSGRFFNGLSATTLVIEELKA